MIITTLPISYRHGRSLKVFSTILTAKTLARLTGSRLILPINLLGLQRNTLPNNPERIVNYFGHDLTAVGVTTEECDIATDLDSDFQNFVTQSLLGKTQRATINLSRCTCGVVELPTSALNVIGVQRRGHNFTDKVCTRCHGMIETAESEVRAITALGKLDIFCTPSVQARRFSTVYGEITRHQLIITKLRNPEQGDLLLDGLVLDPDCALGIFPYFLAHKFKINEVGLVVGFTTLTQVCRAIAISSTLFPHVKVHLFIHPGIKFQNPVMKLPRTPFLEDKHGVSVKDWGVALLMSNQQTRLESVFCEGDVVVAKNTRIRYQQNTSEKPERVSFATASNMLERDAISKVYKKIRQSTPLVTTERLLAEATL